ncbi:MAG TPA: antibiotic biosynthesis monooxygenase family protein [Pyrinomonadaceae bacterium]|nr:antibiotic biosynthesis monooxygenase family protein [Pyrinomonadaceae bacterium]
MVVTTTKIFVRPERRKEFFQTLAPLVQRILSEKGCMDTRVFEETGKENSLILIQEWDSPDSWNDHRAGENFSVLLGLVMVLSIPSKVDFKLLSRIGGNEVISNSYK